MSGINRLVAEKMGWNDSKGQIPYGWNPSENIKDAWVVLCELYKIKGIEITIEINNNEPNYLNIDKHIDRKTYPVVSCVEFELDEFPLAICKAFLEVA